MASRFPHIFQIILLLAIWSSNCKGSANANSIEFPDDSEADPASNWEEPNYSTLSRNLTRCSTTELTLRKESLLHTWKIRGLLKYFNYLKSFEQPFEAVTEDVSFKSDNVDGKWIFKVSRGEEREMRLSCSYSYEAREQRRIHFGILLTVTQSDKELVLPVSKSTKPVVLQSQPHKGRHSTRGLSSSLPLEYVYNFGWPDVLSEFGNDSTDGDLTLAFLITAYFPSPTLSSSLDSCHDVELKEFLRTRVPMQPPYSKHGMSMFHDDRYLDLIVRVGVTDFSAHRIIIATSSPVFSSLLYNKSILQQATNDSTTTMLEIDEDVEPKVVEEMLRYIYTGKVESLDSVADKLILLAYRYILPDLKKICEAKILSRVTVRNAMDVYKLERRNKGRLASQAEQFQNLASKYPNLMFELFLAS